MNLFTRLPPGSFLRFATVSSILFPSSTIASDCTKNLAASEKKRRKGSKQVELVASVNRTRVLYLLCEHARRALDSTTAINYAFILLPFGLLRR